jgi:hypothetical protein
MKFLRDPLGRPIKRLYFSADELDERCERKIADFMDRHCGGFRLPIPTDDIIRMIEADTDDLDLYADLPEGVDAHTDYFVDRNPRVKVAARLSNPRYENRLRTTLAHEYRHVWLHAPLWRKTATDSELRPTARSWRCERETIVTAPDNDWMEWQAGYVCGAILMPRSEVFLLAKEFAAPQDRYPFSSNSEEERTIIAEVVRRFQVSRQAARLRLLRLEIVTDVF